MALSSLGLGRYRQGKCANVNPWAPSRGGFPLCRGPLLGWRRRALASTWWSFNLTEKLQEGTGAPHTLARCTWWPPARHYLPLSRWTLS